MERKQFLELVSSYENPVGLYDLLKESLVLKNDENVDEIDRWFAGIVNSITKYTANGVMFVLVGDSSIGKEEFFKNLLPEDLTTGYTEVLSLNEDALYHRYIVCVPVKVSMLTAVKEHNFVTQTKDKVISANKRMSSYCATSTKWPFNPRKSVITLHVEKINWGVYNDIDKRKLWIEIFNKFKSK